mmetsp:Transcript_13381/g.53684  ORF Transcript_13381/g.53684 Transcript_13381/m.53684 type:complete len:273 (-) Transcript_13381:588-1406(-)
MSSSSSSLHMEPFEIQQGSCGACACRRAPCSNPGLQEAYELSVLSLVASLVAVIMGAVSAIQTRSATALGYSLENTVDFLGSLLVLWRFAGASQYESKHAVESREQRADAGISIMFVVLGGVVAGDAVKDMVDHDGDRDLVELIAMYSPSVVVFVLLGAAKIHVGRSVKSHSLQKDGACSLAGALLSAGVLVSAVIEDFTDIRWIDSFIAIIVASGLAATGICSLPRLRATRHSMVVVVVVVARLRLGPPRASRRGPAPLLQDGHLKWWPRC